MAVSEENIFYEAITLPTHEREAYLVRVCDNDPSRIRRLQRLLAAHDHENHFLDLADTQITSRSALTLTEGDKLGAYVLQRKLGEGGFGVVFLAEQLHPVQRQVAIKVIKPGLNSGVSSSCRWPQSRKPYSAVA